MTAKTLLKVHQLSRHFSDGESASESVRVLDGLDLNVAV